MAGCGCNNKSKEVLKTKEPKYEDKLNIVYKFFDENSGNENIINLLDKILIDYTQFN